MKLVLIVLLIMCVIFSATIPVLAKVKFGDWSKWDEEFPSYKIWERHLGDGPSFWMAVMLEKSQEHIYWASNSFNTNKKDLMSIMVFSYEKPDVNNWRATYKNLKFALAAFPPEEGKEKIVIRAYAKENEILKFLEEWEIPYENDYPVVKPGKFLEAFILWTERSEKLINLDIRLTTFNKGFVIWLGVKNITNVDILSKMEESLK